MIEQFVDLEKSDSNKIPDIMIVDIQMPKMDGFEVVEWIKNNHPKIKIVISSMSSDDATILRMMKMGVDSYLVKNDLDYDEIRYMISEVIKKGNYYTPRITEVIVKSFQNSDLTEAERKILSLTEKEKIIIKLICEELTGSEIALRLSLSNRTIENFTHNIFSKVNVKSRVGLALFAQKNGLLN